MIRIKAGMHEDDIPRYEELIQALQKPEVRRCLDLQFLLDPEQLLRIAPRARCNTETGDCLLTAPVQPAAGSQRASIRSVCRSPGWTNSLS